MKKLNLETIYLYPILFPASIVLTLAVANLVNLTYSEIALTTFALCALVGLVFGLVYLITHNGQRTSFLVFLATLWAAYFGVVVSLLRTNLGLSIDFTQQIIFLIIWTGLFAFIGSPWLWRHVRKPGTITAYMNILMIILIGFSLFRILSFQSGKVDLAKYGNTFPVINDLQTPTHPPDIYYIILDGYGQTNSLADLYAWDNSALLDYLVNKGFYVARESRTNYIQTGLSLSSSMNFNYLPSFPENSRDGRPLFYFIQHNRLFQTIENLGYTTYAFQTAYEASNIVQADHFYAGNLMVRTNSLVSLLMNNSVASLLLELDLIKAPYSTYGEHQNLILNNLSELEKLAAIPGPKFVFLHLLIPHPPFIFDEDEPITPDKVFTLTNESFFEGTAKQYISGYISQVEYLNRALEISLELVLSNSSMPPIIILQGDHGPGAYFNQTIGETCLQERFGILNAYLLPGIDPVILYSSISPVNTFRLVLNEYFGAELDMLPDNHYYSNFKQPYRFIDVGEEIDQPCNIP
jgi:hypothetical protein